MKRLLCFELRKILARRTALFSLAVLLLLSLALSLSTLQSMYAFDGQGREGSGLEAVKIDRELASRYGGVLTDESVSRMLENFRPQYDLHGMNAKYLYQNAVQSSVFARFADLDGNWNGLSVRDVFGAEEIKAGYVNGLLNTGSNLAKLFLALAFVLMFLLAPVFAGEYGGVDGIILSSRYGRTKCAAAKVLAALITVLLVWLLLSGLNLIFAFAVYGTEGLDCSILFAPVEFTEGFIPYNMRCGTLLGWQLLLGLSGALCAAGMALLFSSLCRSSLAAFAISAALYIMPVLLPVSEQSPLYRLLLLLPVYEAQYISLLSAPALNGGLPYALCAVSVSLPVALLLAYFAHRIFSARQVS